MVALPSLSESRSPNSVNIPMEVQADFQHPSTPSTTGITGIGSGTIPLSASPSLSSRDSDTGGTGNRMRIEILARQRVVDSIARAKPIKLPRKRRTCRKCAVVGCPGSQKVSNCRNPCQDCNLVSCRVVKEGIRNA